MKLSVVTAGMQVWDVAMETAPVHTIPVHEHLGPRLTELCETGVVFDKFEACVNGAGT